MKVAVIGATGSVGRQVVEMALSAGHEVTVLSRSPEKLGESLADVRAVRGSVLDLDSVRAVVLGQDAVLCTVGAGRKGIVRAEGTKNIVRAMEESGVRRFVCQTTLGAGDSRGNLNFFWRYVMFGGLLRSAYRDHELQERYLMASDLDWTIVRPAAFTDGKRTGEYRHGFSGSERDIALKISRADVADFLLKQLADETYIGRAPGLSYA